jgi:hypothetical protein
MKTFKCLTLFKGILVSVFILGTISMFAPIAAAAATNLVKNPGFENGFQDWYATINAKVKCDWSAAPTFEISTADKKSGSKSLFCKGLGLDGYPGFAQDIAVKKNTDYNFIFYSNVKAMVKDGEQGNAQVKIYVEDKGGKLTDPVSTAMQQTSMLDSYGTWIKNAWTFNSGNNNVVSIWIQDNGYTGYVDDFEIYETGSSQVTGSVTAQSVPTESSTAVSSSNSAISSAASSSEQGSAVQISESQSASSIDTAVSESSLKSDGANKNSGIPVWLIITVVCVIILAAAGVSYYLYYKNIKSGKNN